jgi:kynurenine formamidase
MSLDHGSSTTFDVHLTVLGADCYWVENLRNLEQRHARRPESRRSDGRAM